MNITVYLGSAHGNDPKYKNEVVRLGNWIGKAGHRLIYGGSRIGLMGELAEAVLTAGGEVIGVEPDFFVNSCLQHHGITRLIVTKTMAERKARMIELGDVFIAFPGGTGTLEEISEVMSQVTMSAPASCSIWTDTMSRFGTCSIIWSWRAFLTRRAEKSLFSRRIQRASRSFLI